MTTTPEKSIATPDTIRQRQIKHPSPELLSRLNEYIAEKGALYCQIDHPALASLKCSWKDQRFEIIKPHLKYQGGTALDIGSHWGYMASRLEEEGYKVTAVEHSPKHVYFLKAIRDISGRQFEIVEKDIFKIGSLTFDLVFALNIFHHFLKTDVRFKNLDELLRRTNCKMMIYQSHRLIERPKLEVAGHFMNAQEMAAWIAERLRLPHVEKIGTDGGRDIFKISN